MVVCSKNEPHIKSLDSLDEYFFLLTKLWESALESFLSETHVFQSKDVGPSNSLVAIFVDAVFQRLFFAEL